MSVLIDLLRSEALSRPAHRSGYNPRVGHFAIEDAKMLFGACWRWFDLFAGGRNYLVACRCSVAEVDQAPLAASATRFDCLELAPANHLFRRSPGRNPVDKQSVPSPKWRADLGSFSCAHGVHKFRNSAPTGLRLNRFRTIADSA
jgi:hypothetical protein